MKKELLQKMTYQDIIELVEAVEAVFDDEIYAGRNPNEMFPTPEAYYTEVLRRLRKENDCPPPLSERYPIVLDAAEKATGRKLTNGRTSDDTIIRAFVSYKLHGEGYSYPQIGSFMRRDHATINLLSFKMRDMFSVPNAYKDEIAMYNTFIGLL